MSDLEIMQPRVTLVIPTRNAGRAFAELLDRAVEALSGYAHQILVIDSGSRDTTVAVARERGVQLHEIAGAAFNHGGTRNLGVSLAAGEFVAFLSQDALPRDGDWLPELLRAFDDDQMAGVYSRVLSGTGASPLVARSVAADLTSRIEPIDQRIDDLDHWFAQTPHERRIAGHFSNVSSCVRRSVALEHPFPELDFGEDLAWAQSVMLAGYTIGYRPESVVLHAHASKLGRDYARYRSDAILHRELFEEHMNALQCARTFVAEVGRDLAALASGPVAKGARYAFYSPMLRGAQALGRWAGFRTSSVSQPLRERIKPRIDRAPLPELSPELALESRDCLPELFDPDFYLAQLSNPERAAADPFEHYLREGDAVGYWPHPLFNPDYYSEQRPLIPREGGARLSHYVAMGGKEILDPHPLFDALWYATQDPRAFAPGVVPLLHYLQHGDALDFWPHPLFDPRYYGFEHPHLEANDGRRLIDFATSRIEDRKSPHALLDAQWMIAAYPEIESHETNLLSFYQRHAEPSGMRPNPFFDPAWYRVNNPDLAEWKLLLYHYVHYGTNERRKPCALFDAPWYEDHYADVRESGLHPIVHYRVLGDALDHWPHPLFDPLHYGAQAEEVERENGNRLRHYETNARTTDADPHPLFSSRWYRDQGYQSQDDERAPIVHYSDLGETEGCWPHPLFDPKHYAMQLAELASKVPRLLVHYTNDGAREGYDPNPMFDGTWYLEQHPELRDSRDRWVNALVHYIECHNRELHNRECLNSEAERTGSADVADPHPLFDARWYREQHAQACAGGLDPLRHFLHIGAYDDADPHPRFDSSRYRNEHALDRSLVPIYHYLAHPDPSRALLEPFFDADYYQTHSAKHQIAQIKRSKNAFAHYLERGFVRGYAPGPLFDFCRSFFIGAAPSSFDPSTHPMAAAVDASWAPAGDQQLERPIAFSYHASPTVSVVIAAHGPVAYTLACLRALCGAKGSASYEVILVVDGPVDADDDPFSEIANITILRNEVAQGFVRATNAGARFARGERLVFLNNDTLVCDDWLDALLESYADFPNAGIVASRLLMPNGRLQEIGSIVFEDGRAANYGYGEDADAPAFHFAREADYASAAALMIDRLLFESLDGFDERFAPAFYEDTDLAFRVREAGLDVICQPRSSVVHFGGVNYARDSRTGRNPFQDANRKTFTDRWAHVLSTYETSDTPASRAVLRGVKGRILVIDATMPTPLRDSGSLRMFNMLRVLRRMHYRVTFVPADLSHPKREVERMRAAGIEVHVPPYIESVAGFLEAHGSSFDLCVLSRPQTAGRYLAAVKSCCPNAQVVYDTVDLHYLRRNRQIALLGQSDLSGLDVVRESFAYSSADRVLVVSEFDRAELAKALPSARIDVVSNMHECVPGSRGFDERSDVLFIGGFRHTPNVDAMLWFTSQIMPLVLAERPDVVLRIVGSDMPNEICSLASRSVLIEGYVEDPNSLFESCLLSIAPLRYGSGVKGKVNQSMSRGLPVVATSIAAEGLEARHDRELLIADDPQAFADGILRLHDDPECWGRLSRASLANVAQHFSMEIAEARLNDLLEQCGLPRQLKRLRSDSTASR